MREQLKHLIEAAAQPQITMQVRPRRARDLAEDGMRYLTAGPNGVGLYIKYAQAAAACAHRTGGTGVPGIGAGTGP
jgi:hypothetical protein